MSLITGASDLYNFGCACLSVSVLGPIVVLLCFLVFWHFCLVPSQCVLMYVSLWHFNAKVCMWFILRRDLLYVFPCVILFLCFLVLLVLRLPRFGKRELILVLFVRLFGLCLFRFVGFLFLLGFGKGCGLWLWHSLDFSLTFYATKHMVEIWSQIRIRVRFRTIKTGFSPWYFPTSLSKAVPVLHLCYCKSVVSYVAFVLSLFVFPFFLFCCIEKAMFSDCSISRIS